MKRLFAFFAIFTIILCCVGCSKNQSEASTDVSSNCAEIDQTVKIGNYTLLKEDDLKITMSENAITEGNIVYSGKVSFFNQKNLYGDISSIYATLDNGVVLYFGSTGGESKSIDTDKVWMLKDKYIYVFGSLKSNEFHSDCEITVSSIVCDDTIYTLNDFYTK